uniref:Gustatory receptor n=1 Tax=Tetranychus urticae TaxID=32264 RepID=T1K2M6_TETUR
MLPFANCRFIFFICRVNILESISRRIPFQVKVLIKKFFGLLSDDDSDEETVKSIQVLENIALGLMMTRRGHRQDETSYVQPHFHFKNNLIRFVSILNFIRFYLILIYNQNDNLSILLGNPFFHENSSDIMICYVIGGGITLFVFREYVLYVEDTRAYPVLCTLRDIKVSGFDSNMLKLTTKQCKWFRSTFHLLITIWIRWIYCVFICTPFALIILRIQNQAIVNSGPAMYISHFCWIVLESCTFIFIFGSFLNLAAHVTVSIPLYLCRLKSLIELLKRVRSKQFIDDSIIKGMNTDVISYMNEFDKNIVTIRYLFFFVFILVSFGADTAIFLGLSTKGHSKWVSNMLVIRGLLVLFIVGSIVYVGSATLDQLYVIHGLYVSIIAKASVKLEQKLKTLEILDRILSPYCGAKVGDAFRGEKLLAVYYVLENASTIMLLICNLQFISS